MIDIPFLIEFFSSYCISEAAAAPYVSNVFTETQRDGLRRLGAAVSSVLETLGSRGEFFAIGKSILSCNPLPLGAKHLSPF